MPGLSLSGQITLRGIVFIWANYVAGFISKSVARLSASPASVRVITSRVPIESILGDVGVHFGDEGMIGHCFFGDVVDPENAFFRDDSRGVCSL
jgi:hypothetical protein